MSKEELIQLEKELMDCGFQWLQARANAKTAKEKAQCKTLAIAFFTEAEEIKRTLAAQP
jgi:hypothetical protein